ncbi:beta glucosidase 13 [Corchorus olitorius]|uniref:Beta glucosidase 13 n=1 Tax=Corchorus olitorius TaxID=93759 RepID=A0A1R3I2Y1_9ROSI|nr:beta glucosidase 13 [Corchorus olitorius]
MLRNRCKGGLQIFKARGSAVCAGVCVGGCGSVCLPESAMVLALVVRDAYVATEMASGVCLKLTDGCHLMAFLAECVKSYAERFKRSMYAGFGIRERWHKLSKGETYEVDTIPFHKQERKRS